MTLPRPRQLNPDDDPDGPRAGGMQRITLERQTRAVCLGCGYEMDNSGAAASHARSRRHAVHVEYSTTFVFARADRLTQMLGGDQR